MKQRVSTRWREMWDRIVASDPGLSRLRMATGGVVSMVTALGVEFVAAQLYGAEGMQVVLFLLMGGMVAMMGSMALSGLGPGIWIKVRTAAFFPVAFGAGMTLGAVTHRNTGLDLSVFVVVTFLAVFMRRFGIPFFFYGFMSWIGYLFSSLLGATFEILPMILLALAIGTVWVLLLSTTVLSINPARILSLTLQAFHARVRTIVTVCADLADIDPHDAKDVHRWRSRLERQQRRLSEAALMIEAASGEHEALPDAEAGRRLRNYALDAQLAVDALAGSIDSIATDAPDLAGLAAQVADLVARRELGAAGRAAEELQRARTDATPEVAGAWWPAYRLVEAVSSFATLATRQREQGRLSAHLTRPGKRKGGRADPDAADRFQSAVEFRMGNLPSVASLARDVAPRGPRWLLGRVSMTTRQSIQVAVAAGLAIIAGNALSSHRYYWALIAVFVTFTGTTTRAESVRKALYRLLGTLVGLAVAMLLAHATAGNTTLVLVVIVASMFCGFYLIRISYAFMIFFITIMVAQLYTVLGEYSNHLLILRLEETAIGAAIGIVVALAFLPLSTRDTVRAARDKALDTLGEALTTIAARLDPASAAASDTGEKAAGERDEHDAAGAEAPPTLEELSRRLDDDVRQLAAVATPFSSPAMWGNNGRHLRYRLTRYSAIAGNIRAVTVALRWAPAVNEPALAEMCRSIADTAGALRAGTDALRTGNEPADTRISTRLRERLAASPAPQHDAITRFLMRINGLLTEIAPPEPPRATGTAAD